MIGAGFSGKSFDPTEGKQLEAGIKYAIPGYPAFITLSAFQLTQQNALTANPDHPGFSIQTGEVRSRGIELEGVASLGNWDAIASYSYLGQEVTESNDDDLGKRLRAVPRQKAALWVDYAFNQSWARGLQVGVGATYTGSSAGDRLNTFNVDPYILFDAAVNYDLSALHNSLKGWKISLNATNLADNTYVASSTSAVGCYYGMGRSIIARLRWTLY